MPSVGGKKYSYTPSGRKKAAAAAKASGLPVRNKPSYKPKKK